VVCDEVLARLQQARRLLATVGSETLPIHSESSHSESVLTASGDS
jgi:hypothetical protein